MIQLYIPKYLETGFSDGFIYKDEEDNVYNLYNHEIGNIRILDGNIIACDPFLFNNDLPFTTKFPIGTFPVQLSIAQINDDERVAFARIKFSEEIPFSWSLAVREGQDLLKLGENEIYGYGVDAGTGAFMDTSGAKEFMVYLNEKDDNFMLLIDDMKKNYKHTWDYLNWEKNQTNVIMFKSGWGDGYYATYIGFDKSGNICRLVTDFVVLE